MPKQVSDSAILAATFETLLAHGYDGATTRLIAAAANVNEVTLFRKYGTKTNLVLAAVRQEAEDLRQAGIAYSGDLAADLEQIVAAYIAIFAERGRVIPLIVGELPRRPELRVGLRELWAILTPFLDIIARYQADRRLLPEPPLHTLSALLSPVLALSVVRGLHPDAAPPLDAATHVRAFLRGRAAASVTEQP